MYIITFREHESSQVRSSLRPNRLDAFETTIVGDRRRRYRWSLFRVFVFMYWLTGCDRWKVRLGKSLLPFPDPWTY